MRRDVRRSGGGRRRNLGAVLDALTRLTRSKRVEVERLGTGTTCVGERLRVVTGREGVGEGLGAKVRVRRREASDRSSVLREMTAATAANALHVGSETRRYGWER